MKRNSFEGVSENWLTGYDPARADSTGYQPSFPAAPSPFYTPRKLNGLCDQPELRFTDSMQGGFVATGRAGHRRTVFLRPLKSKIQNPKSPTNR